MMNQYSTYKEVDLPWLKKIPQHWGIVRNREILKEKTDVVISGLGWITLVGTGQEITVHAPKGVGVLVRPSLI